MKADGLLPADTEVRFSKSLNNLIEQDHRNIRSRTNVMLGFKRFRTASVTLAGIELMHRIRKGQLTLPDCTSKIVLRSWFGILFSRINKRSYQNRLPRSFSLFAPEPAG